MAIRREDSTAKCLVFSQWPTYLKYLGTALEQNDILSLRKSRVTGFVQNDDAHDMIDVLP